MALMAAATRSGNDSQAALSGQKRKEWENHDPYAAAGTAELPPCCAICLGALQVLGAGDVANNYGAVGLATTVSTLQSDEGYWESGAAPAVTTHVAPCASLQAAAAAIAAEYELGPFAIEVSLPASTAVRTQALAWWLAGSNAAADGAAREGPVSLKEAVRLVAGALLERALGQPQDQQSGLRIALTWTHAGTAEEAAWLSQQGQRGSKGRRGRGPAGSNEELGLAASEALVSRLALMPRPEFEAGCPPAAVALTPPAAGAMLRVQATRRALHVGGRYLKLRRGVPQSPWFINGQRKGEGSVQEALARTVLPHFRADSYTFLAAGREDIDVRMLGEGRPFVLEVLNARRHTLPAGDCAAMETALEASDCGVRACGLRAVPPEAVKALKEGEQEKEKSYRALCWLPRPLTDADVGTLAAAGPLTLTQRTPIRVLHRRANMAREKVVYELRAERLEAQQQQQQQQGGEYFLLFLRTAAGTYIKEFVHGDLGRTRPSMGDLLGGCRAEIASLDVMEVHMDGQMVKRTQQQFALQS